MEGLAGLAQNNYLVAAFIAWFIAQLSKFVLSLVFNRALDFKLFVSSGGMPSSHSAFVMALTAAIGFNKGWDAPLTAVALIFSLVVMYDAAGVRRAAGKQAEILNKLIFESKSNRQVTEQRLKELIGHTPIEVITGALLGVIIAYFMPN